VAGRSLLKQASRCTLHLLNVRDINPLEALLLPGSLQQIICRWRQQTICCDGELQK